MAPNPRECVSDKKCTEGTFDPGERVVISGMAGLYPDSFNVKDLSDILYNKVNPVKRTNRWKYNHPEVAQYTGNVPDLQYFDAQFFKVHYRLCNNMDAMARKILEQAYQAIYDAGVSPEHLSGKKVGVYIGTCFSETEKACFYVASSRTGFGIAGCSKTMFANRISYWLNAKGPSMSIDEACCSSTAALELAYLAISRGECEAAIVGGANLCLHPQSSVHYGRIMTLSMDGKTKSFDTEASGCAKSEAINVLFLQKAKDARRIYADVIHAKCEFTSIVTDETGPKYGFYRNPKDVVNFLKTFYRDANVSPQAVQYVEALGSAVPEADKAELEAIDEIFCKNRSKPLMVGSVMSNIGYGEAASGISAVTKVLLGYHYGKLAANLDCQKPRQDVAALQEGRISIVNEHQEFDRAYTAVNSLSITGINAHILLHGHYKPKDLNRYKASIPRLVLLSGRQESAVKKIIDDLKSRPIDPEEHALLHNIHETKISGHLGRGFVILDTNENNETMSLGEASEYFDQAKRPLWFVYSGMGSQWTGMGKELMRIPIFAAAIERCRRALEPKGIDIVHIITSDDKNMFDNILHSFVGIAAIQIGLTDILRELEIFPDMIIGHSVGELGCAYADGCFTTEEMILSAYSRGLVSLQTPLIRGSMAAVGLGFKEVSKLCPPEIEVACHNASDSSTISGPADLMTKFVDSLTSKGIFAKEVPCSNIAYHSRYIADAGPGLLKYLKEVIKSPKPRSSRWVSTSVPQDRWDEPLAKYSSAEYHTNNLLNSVLFEETSKLIPPDAMVIEIAPHGLLQAILKRSLPASCRLLPLTRRKHPDNARFLLESIGRLSLEGFNPKIKALYPKVEFPVSTGTPMLSHLVEWAHNEKWNIALYAAANRKVAAAANYVLSLHDDEHNYLRGHVIRGKVLYPYAAALVSVWDTFAMVLGEEPKNISVEFQNVYLHSQPVLHERRQLRLNVALHRGTGKFEVLNGNAIVIRGIIINAIDQSNKKATHTGLVNVESKDIYKLFDGRDYHYMNEFRSIHSANEALTEAQIIWNDNWVTFIDGILQMNVLRRQHNTISKVKFIRKISIDVCKHIDAVQKKDGINVMNANLLETFDYTICGGVSIENIKFTDQNLEEDIYTALQIQKTTSNFSADNSVEKLEDKYFVPRQQVDLKNGSTLKCARIGDIESFHWASNMPNDNVGADVDVHYASINMVDVNRYLGVKLKKDYNKNCLEIDFSGTIASGNRVMGIVQSEAITSKLKANTELLWPVPNHWSLEDAATVPLAYSLAFYMLFIKAHLRSNFIICVHGGTGALGQAVISIALAHGCEVFTTVSSAAKKQFLRKLFPQLQDDHIGNSRDLSFGDMILTATHGKGCNIVITNTAGELKNTSLKCCGSSGIIFDTSLIQSQEDYQFGMHYLTIERSYVLVDFSSIFKPEYFLENAKTLRLLLSEGIALGYVRPLSRIIFSPHVVSRAFTLQATRRHYGRVLLNLRELASNIRPRIACTSSKWQLIISDDEDLSLKLIEKLIKQGSKKVIFILEKPSQCINVQHRAWNKNGIDLKLINGDIWNESVVFNSITSVLKDIENIFVISDETSAKSINMLNKLATTIHSSRTPIKYFALITTAGINEKYSSYLREQKIATIKLPVIKKIGTEETTANTNALSLNSAVEIMEEALCTKHLSVTLHKSEIRKTTLLDQIFKITGVKKENVPRDMTSDLSLQELDMDYSKVGALQAYLSDLYDVYLPAQTLPALTIKEINEIEKDHLGYGFEEEKGGLAPFFSSIDTDELLSTTEMIFLKTLISSSSMRDDEFDVSQTYLCIVPGVEGHNSRFHTMCERLKLPALVLQPGLNKPNETLSELAQRYAKLLLKKTELKKTFYLLGYECGVLVALEMAAILEKNGLTGTVYCVGGTPKEIISNFQRSLSDYKTKEDLQQAVLKYMCALMTNEKSDHLDNIIYAKMEWHEKLNVCIHKLHGRIPYSIQYARELIETAYGRLKEVLQHSPNPKMLRSKIISLRPLYSMNMDFSLHNYSQQKVITYQLRAPLSLATQDLACAAIINRHLDSEILDVFRKKNLCETYLLNADSFMTPAND